MSKLVDFFKKNFMDEEDDIENIEEDEILEQTKSQKIQSRPRYTEEKNKKVKNIMKKEEREENIKMRNGYVSIIRPKSYQEVETLMNLIKQGKIVTFSLEYLTDAEIQRMIDTISGAAYVADGKLKQITEVVFNFIPNGIEYEDVDLDEESRIRKGNFL